MDEAVQRKVKFAEAMSEDNKWLTLMKSVSGATMLSQELVDESVEPVSYTHLDVYKRQVIDASPSALVIASQRIMLTPIFPLPVRSSPS